MSDPVPPSPTVPARTEALPAPGSDAHEAALDRTGLFLGGPYLETYPDVPEAGMEALAHYCRHGWAEGRVGNAWFDAPHYAAQVAALGPGGRLPARDGGAMRAALEAAGRPGTDCDPLLHYARLGVALGLAPSAYLDPGWYRAAHMRGLPAEADPLLHFLRQGEAEDLRPAPWFDTAWYRERHGLACGRSPLSHFLAHRHGGAVSPLPEFDTAFYTRRRRDVPALRQDPFQHYLHHGAREGADPSPGFESGFYAARYLRTEPEANPLLHFLRHRHRPGVFPTRGAALRDALLRLARTGRRDVTLPLGWMDGVASGSEALRAFLEDPTLPGELRVVWGNERMAARPGLARGQKRALLRYREDADEDGDVCAFLATCLDDPRYARGKDGRRPVLLYGAAEDEGLPAVMARWRELLPEDTALLAITEWPDTAW